MGRIMSCASYHLTIFYMLDVSYLYHVCVISLISLISRCISSTSWTSWGSRFASCNAPSCRGQHDAKSDGHLRLTTNTTNTTPLATPWIYIYINIISSHLQSSPIPPQNLLSLNLTRMSRSNDSFQFSWVRWSDSEGMLMGMWAQCWKLEIERMINERLKWWNVVKRGETSLSNCLSKRLSVVRCVVRCLRGKSSRSASHRGLGCLAWRVQQVARYLTETEI